MKYMHKDMLVLKVSVSFQILYLSSAVLYKQGRNGLFGVHTR